MNRDSSNSLVSLSGMRNIGSSASLRSIPSSASIYSDQFYRYKRSSVEVTYKNTGNGQTVIDNINKISHELETKPENLIRYLKKQFNVSFDRDGVIHAKLDKEKIETEIDKYIDLYVLCPRCKLPEYHDKHCNACGYTPSKSEYKIRSKDKMIRDIHDCLNGVKRVVDEMTPELEFEKKLSNEMNELYIMRDSSACDDQIKELDFILDCVWSMPDIDDLVEKGGKVTSKRYISGVEKMIELITRWKEGDDHMKKVVRVLTNISRMDRDECYESEELELLKNDNILKHFKCLYSKHLKDTNIINNWYNRIYKMKIDKIFEITTK